MWVDECANKAVMEALLMTKVPHDIPKAIKPCARSMFETERPFIIDKQGGGCWLGGGGAVGCVWVWGRETQGD